MLRAVTWHFADTWFERKADESQDGCDFVIEWRKHEGQVMLNWQRLIEKETSLQAMFPGPPAELELSDVLVRLRTDQTANTCSWQRRDACRRLLAFLFLVISDCIEASLRSKLWSETKVEQLKQLRTRLRGLCFVLGFVLPLFFGLLNDRTARGYRQVSFGFRQAIVERTKNAKMQDAAAQWKPHRRFWSKAGVRRNNTEQPRAVQLHEGR